MKIEISILIVVDLKTIISNCKFHIFDIYLKNKSNKKLLPQWTVDLTCWGPSKETHHLVLGNSIKPISYLQVLVVH